MVQLTPPGIGAIAVLLVAGSPGDGRPPGHAPASARDALVRLSRSGRIAALSPGQIVHTQLLAAPDAQGLRASLDDALVVCTAPDRFELHLHGGVAVMQAVQDALAQWGVQQASPEVAAACGLLGTPYDAALALALPRALTLTGVRLLAAQRSAGMAAWVRHWQERLRQGSPLWPLQSAAQWLLLRSNTLARLLHPPRIAIVGPPNAGKSTLANALLGRPVSITSDVPGTTRDWVDAQAVLSAGDVDLAVTLVDTAGIRDTHDPLEQESIRRSHHQAGQADLVLLVFDATSSLPETLRQTLPAAPCLLVRNKIDLAPSAPSVAPNVVDISAAHRRNLDHLMRAALRKLDLEHVDPREPFAFAPQQQSLLHDLAHAPSKDGAIQLLDRLAPPDALFPSPSAPLHSGHG